MSRYCRTYMEEIPDDQIEARCKQCNMACIYNDVEKEKYPEE